MTIERIHAINAELVTLKAEHDEVLTARGADRSEHHAKFNETLSRLSTQRTDLDAEKERLKKPLIRNAEAKFEHLSASVVAAHARSQAYASAKARIQAACGKIEDAGNDYARQLDDRLTTGAPITLDTQTFEAMAFFFGEHMREKLQAHLVEWHAGLHADTGDDSTDMLEAAQAELRALRDL